MTQTIPVTGNTSQTQPENRAFYPALDGLRAIAFLMVLLQHYVGLEWGWIGVDLFFVLSGFLITGILFDTRTDRHRARNFYVRRTLRIFPLYYGIMLVLLLTTPFWHWAWSPQWLAWPLYLGNYLQFLPPHLYNEPAAHFQPQGSGTLTLYLGHFWSLCVEEQFYLVWPWVVFWVRDRRTLMIVCAAMLPLCLAMRLAGQHYFPGWLLDNEVLYRATPFVLDALLLGGLLALGLRGTRAADILRWARLVFPVLAAMLLVAFCLDLILHRAAAAFHSIGKYTWGLTLVDFIAAALVLSAIQPGTFIYRILKVRPLRWLGRITYGAYVLHDIPHNFYMRVTSWLLPAGYQQIHGARYDYCLCLVAFAFTCPLAWLSFRFFETPFLNLKERWTSRIDTHSPGLASVRSPS